MTIYCFLSASLQSEDQTEPCGNMALYLYQCRLHSNYVTVHVTYSAYTNYDSSGRWKLMIAFATFANKMENCYHLHTS